MAVWFFGVTGGAELGAINLGSGVVTPHGRASSCRGLPATHDRCRCTIFSLLEYRSAANPGDKT